MKSIDFPERNGVLAEDQPEYEKIFVHMDKSLPSVPMTCIFELTEDEIEEIVKNKKLYYTRLTFGFNFQPMSIWTQNPFIKKSTDNATQEKS